MSFTKTLAEKKSEIESYINQLLSEITDVPETLLSSVRYSLANGGKRMRPMLMMESILLFKNELSESDIKFIVAIECIHIYSLIHDDLPCMDDDDLRRGKPTNHKVYGEAVAVLAGDALLNLAYELMIEAISLAEKPAPYVEAAKIISSHAGSRGMIAGQVLELDIKEDIVSHAKISNIFQHKTGDLICSALLAGAIIGGASKKEQNAILRFGEQFSYAFQIKDDILDYENKDKPRDNKNFVYIYGMTAAKSTVIESIDLAINEISKLGKDITFFKKIALKSIERKE